MIEEKTTPELITEFKGETLGETVRNLLAEIKRLREDNKKLNEAIGSCCSHGIGSCLDHYADMIAEGE